LNLGAAVVLVTNSNSEQVPDDVEVHPLSALEDLAGWADWIAFDVTRWNLQDLRDRLGEKDRFSSWPEAEILIRTPIPCGGMADCGVCAVFMRSGWKMACKEGPVFRWGAI
jgi:dihydroorotate dehydrogenase electron transfer subunit